MGYFNSKGVRGRLQSLMKHAALTQKDIARKAGLSTAFVNDVLNARREPSGKLLDWMGLERIVLYRVKPKSEPK